MIPIQRNKYALNCNCASQEMQRLLWCCQGKYLTRLLNLFAIMITIWNIKLNWMGRLGRPDCLKASLQPLDKQASSNSPVASLLFKKGSFKSVGEKNWKGCEKTLIYWPNIHQTVQSRYALLSSLTMFLKFSPVI